MTVVTYPGLPNDVLTANELAVVDKAVGWPQQAIGQAVAIEENQSEGGNTDAYNPTDPAGGSEGLFQINGVHSPTGQMTPQFAAEMADPVANSEEALALYSTQGWQPWQGDASLAPPYTNLTAGDNAAAVVRGTSQAQLQSVVMSSNTTGTPTTPGLSPYSRAVNLFKTIGDAATGNLPAAGSALASATTGQSPSSLGSTIWGYAAKGIGAIAGLGLVVLALKEAGTSDKDGGDHLGLAKAGEAAAL